MTLRITTAVLVALAAATGQAASGFFNMPSSLPQQIGCGWGPGYHAELALKPYHHAWNASKGIVRVRPRRSPALHPQQAPSHYHAHPAPAAGVVYQGGPTAAQPPAPATAGPQLFSAPPAAEAIPAGQPDPLPLP
ncbi:hypothetical protein KOR34_35090 [Posidoniimonas corsicana]|uniref:Uncharacterized protein n=1 Tax=Posidoniimonas corsicana TaxID=1938618 RepID=A0A5C5V573_9BACT|nr:hypothetical protein [Posidoniimonas corsicana]TWT33676.1 hypothetical protein KOR34_35090 [Posidoniimonas corsicana]